MDLKLQKIQSKLKAPKNQFNSFSKYHYRSQEDILEAVKPLLAEEKLLLTLTDEIVEYGSRYYVKATATITDSEKSLSVSALAREAEIKKGMDEAQITGASSSYARKYALNGLFLIDDTRDADSEKPVEKPMQEKTKKEIIVEICKEINPTLDSQEVGKFIKDKTQFDPKDEKNYDEIISRLEIIKKEA